MERQAAPLTTPGLRSVRRSALGAIALMALVSTLTPGAAVADPTPEAPTDGFALRPLEPAPRGDQVPPVDLPVQLILDDGGAEATYGLIGGSARQFLWLNQFENPGNFSLEEIWVLFPDGADVPLGGAIQLAVYLDPDGDPTNGADLVATYDDVIQAADGSTFSIYPIAPLELGDGDVLIGVVNRYYQTGSDPPPTQPAALDTTDPQGRSYAALWTGDPPDPPDLGSALIVDQLDGVAAGNFLIRGFGSEGPIVAVPTVDVPGLLLLAALLAAAGFWRLARRA